MEYTLILTSVVERAGLIQINRPQQLNALNAVVMEELAVALEEFDHSEQVGCIVITGNQRAFAAGADIKEMVDATAVEMLQRDSIARWDRIRKIKKPVIAAVSGFCLGGGCELAMACTLRIASDRARFGQPEVNLGVIPGYGGTQRLPRLVGKGKALEMILTGAPIGAEEALRLGLVNSVVPSTELLAAADRLARVISAKSRPAIRLAMEAVQASAGHSLQEGQMKEAALFGKSCGTEDFHEGTRAFLEKRPPAFRST